MSDHLPEIPAHQAKDRFGKIAVHTAYEISRALTESGEADDGVVVLRTDGPHRSLAGLQRLIDDALADEDAPSDPGDADPRRDDGRT
ncbi:MAG TPA: hypothetical protein VGJ13_05770 [Pseudonocardiaceae bacterium]